MNPNRPYDEIARSVAGLVSNSSSRKARMRVVVDLLWAELAERGVSWVGFYLKSPDADEMVLGPRRDKPACSPIGLQGACGRCWREKVPLVVRDVRDLGADYIACDPRDRSEVVLPLLEPDGSAWGVLDLDSYQVGAFDESDVAGLQRVLDAAFG
jgi:putative methionine-R-sulfoxide reductase with GAF domain